MFHAVILYLNNNPESVSEIHGMGICRKNFADVLNSIVSAAARQGINRKGVSADKKMKQDELVMRTTHYCDVLRLYARLGNNEVMLSEADFSKSDIEDMKDVSLLSFARFIRTRIHSILDILKNGGYPFMDPVLFDEAIEAFEASLVKPRLEIAGRSVITREISELFRKAYRELKTMDALAAAFRVEKSGFFAGYRSARKIVHPNRRKASVRGKALEAATGRPLSGVTFTFTLADEGISPARKWKVLVKKSSREGGFMVWRLNEGRYLVRVSRPGFKEQSLTADVRDGERCEVVARMEEIRD